MNNGDFPAHPASASDYTIGEMGLTKRELIAAMAMQGMLAQMGQLHSHPSEYGIEKQSVVLADLLLEELSKPKP